MTETIIVCKNHPSRETSLRCNRCNEPICTSCAKPTPTGYRCPQCIAGQKKVFVTAKAQDYVLGFVIAAFLSYFGALIARLIGSIGFFGLIIMLAFAPFAGSMIAEAVRRVTGRRRSKMLFQTIIIGMVVGTLPFLIQPLILVFSGALGALFGIIWPGLYLFLASSAAWYRLSGIQLNR